MVVERINAEQGEGIGLKETMSVEGYPTFIVTDARGETIRRWMGYDKPAGFIDSLEQAVADPTTIAEKAERYRSAPSLDDAVALAEFHASKGEFPEAAKFYEAALAREDAGPRVARDAFDLYAWGLDKGKFTSDQLRRAADRLLESGSPDARQMLDVARVMARASREDDDWSPAPYIERALEISRGDPELSDERRQVLIEEALHVTGDKQRALELERETLPEGWEEDSDALNAFAWWCFENRINLDEAETLARRGAELAGTDRARAMILDTAAEIVFLRGDADEAVTLTRQAMELDPGNAYYGEQLARFGGGKSGSS